MRSFQSLFIIVFSLCSSLYVYAQQNQLSKKDTSEVRFVNSRKFWIYKVDKGETLFSISQKFKIPQEEIHEFNSDLATTGLKAKMKIWIPAYSWINKNKPEEKAQEEPLKDRDDQKSRLKILVITNLDLHKIYLAKEAEFDTTEYIKEPIPSEIIENLEFFEGVLLAAKEISRFGDKLEIVIKDSQNDTSAINSLFSKMDLNSLDLIITNEKGSSLRTINKFSLRGKIPLFSAGINTTEIIRDNVNAYAVSPSSVLQCKLMGNTASELFKNSNCLLLKTGISREDERTQAFKQGWMELYKHGQIKSVKFSGSYNKALTDSMQKTRLNVLFVPSSNEDIISSLLSALKENAIDYKLNVIGLPTWLYSQSIDPALFDTCNTYLFSAGYIDFENNSVADFRKKFRDDYHSEPRDAAYLGFDVLQVAHEMLFPNAWKKLKDKKRTIYNGLYSSYQFLETDNGVCKENHVIQFYKFENDVPVHLRLNEKAD